MESGQLKIFTIIKNLLLNSGLGLVGTTDCHTFSYFGKFGFCIQQFERGGTRTYISEIYFVKSYRLHTYTGYICRTAKMWNNPISIDIDLSKNELNIVFYYTSLVAWQMKMVKKLIELKSLRRLYW